MADLFNDVKPSDVVFLENLRESKYSAVFKVQVREKTCVMKVHRDRGSSSHDPPYREMNLFIRESTAYRRLKAKGFCDRGVIPNFYGTITKIEATDWPDLHMFHEDKLPPNAILIEYIPNMQQIDLSNFSESYLHRFRGILHEIHKARVYHGDAYPRNMMISPGKTTTRVLWIDFDSAQTFPEEGALTSRQKMWIEQEVELVDYFVKNLPEDYKEAERVLGFKARQAVSKDLRKRIPPGLGSRAGARDPHVEIDLTAKELTDDRFAAFVDDLINCIQYRDEEHPNGIIRLTELVVKGNALTVASVKKLGHVVALSSDCLTQLNISDNRISSLKGCYVLKKIDFAGNPLGGAGFDVLARVFVQSDLDFIEPLANEGSKHQVDTDVVVILSKAVDVISLVEKKKNRKPPDYLKVFGFQIDCLGGKPTGDSNYRRARGLQSVPYLVFSNSCITNACAFHLWTIILSHHQPDTLLEFLPPGKSVAPPEQINPLNGIVYTPNEKLSALGKRLLELGNEFRIQDSDIDAEER
ncbi:hypothetical protein EMCG_00666 [[Emmonsia] crescens]|uniref:Protein kinase domain-containing protein n=1 Tax=[Emmonsia] crescens TaxID=73230 RepID=A0A0G2HT85_9EURO|nr:hypothetical protein EMCG_00666 [Emmonsia crescens UAMH 3008]